MLLLPFSLAHGAEVEAALLVRVESAIDLAADRATEDDLELRSSVVGRAASRGSSRWFLEVEGQHLLLAGWPEGEVEGAFSAHVGESGGEGRLAGPLRLRVGNLVERWGRLDLLPVADLIAPRDLSAGPLVDPDRIRLPAPMIRLQAGGGHGRAELSWLPFSAADRVRVSGSDWSLLRQGMVSGLLADMQGWEGDALTEELVRDAIGGLQAQLDDLDASSRRAVVAALGEQGRPEDLGLAGDLALRLEGDAGPLDGALMGAWMRSRQPMLNLDPTLRGLLQEERLPGLTDQGSLLAQAPLEVAWPRTFVVAAELGLPLGPVGLRVEGAWLSDRVVARQWMGGATSPELSVGLGLDWAPLSSLALGAEGRWRLLLDPPSDPWLRAQSQVELALGGRLGMLRDRLHLQAGGAVDLAFAEWLLRGELAWRASDLVELGVGALLLGGPDAPPVDLRRALAWEGGPLGYWGDNDCLTIRASVYR